MRPLASVILALAWTPAVWGIVYLPDPPVAYVSAWMETPPSGVYVRADEYSPRWLIPPYGDQATIDFWSDRLDGWQHNDREMIIVPFGTFEQITYEIDPIYFLNHGVPYGEGQLFLFDRAAADFESGLTLLYDTDIPDDGGLYLHDITQEWHSGQFLEFIYMGRPGAGPPGVGTQPIWADPTAFSVSRSATIYDSDPDSSRSIVGLPWTVIPRPVAEASSVPEPAAFAIWAVLGIMVAWMIHSKKSTS